MDSDSEYDPEEDHACLEIPPPPSGPPPGGVLGEEMYDPFAEDEKEPSEDDAGYCFEEEEDEEQREQREQAVLAMKQRDKQLILQAKEVIFYRVR